MRSMPGNSCDGHARNALQHAEILRGCGVGLVLIDCGYRGYGVLATQVLISDTRHWLTPHLRKLQRRRSAIEPEIDHMKSDRRLARGARKGTIGGAVFAVLCGFGHDIRKILVHLRSSLLALLTSRVQALTQADGKAALWLTV